VLGTVFLREVIIQAGCSEAQNPAQTSSSSKNAGLFCELKKANAFLISQGKTCNVFLTKMDALLRKRSAKTASLNQGFTRKNRTLFTAG
jgi:hypothetical protein